MSDIRTGLVMRSTGSSYTVRDSVTGRETDMPARGKLRLKGVRTTNPVAVGDMVDYRCDDSGQAAITDIHPRSNYMIRRASNLSKESHVIAANLDQAAVVVTLSLPETKTEFIDRFLVTCEAYEIPAFIVLNKMDIAGRHPDAVGEFEHIYSLAGYEVLKVSGTTGENMEAFAGRLSGCTTLLSGNSGVGKSTLIKYLHPQAEVRIAQISDYHGKGRHTTTFSRMYPLPSGGYIIDTPGIKGFGLIDIENRELHQFFPEFMKYSPDCQYYNCTHTHEPGCAVVEAIKEGNISESRYISYLKMLEEDEKYRK